YELRTRQREQAQQEVDLLAQAATRNEHQAFGALGELVRELHRNAAAERLTDQRRALVTQREHEVTNPARERPERVVAARLLGFAVAGEVGRDHREVLRERGEHV